MQADFVLAICTEEYSRRATGRSERSVGRGVRWEGAIIVQELYDSVNTRIVPVTLTEDDQAHIPYFLRATSHYPIDLDTDTGLEPLLRRVFNEPEVTARPIGPRPSFGTGAHAASRKRGPQRQLSRHKSRSGVSAEEPPANAKVGLSRSLTEATQHAILAQARAAAAQPMDSVLLVMRQALTAFSEVMRTLSAAQCRVSIIEVHVAATGSPSLVTRTLSTSSGPAVVAQRPNNDIPLASDSDLTLSFNEGTQVRIDDVLQLRGYRKSHWVAPAPPPYRSTIVTPIRVTISTDPEDTLLYGFLCVDATEPGSLDGHEISALCISFAALLYLVLDAVRASQPSAAGGGRFPSV